MCNCQNSCSNKDIDNDSFTDILLVCKICELPSLKDKPEPPNPWPVYIYRICVDCESKIENGNLAKANERVEESRKCECCEDKFYGIGSVTITAERHRPRHWDLLCEGCAQWVVDVWRNTSGRSDIFYDCHSNSDDVKETVVPLKQKPTTRKSI